MINLYARGLLQHNRNVKPKNMSPLEVTTEQLRHMEELVLGIFADCTNGGLAFNDVLCAIYLSGLHHGSAFKPIN
jgi:hypothetical protein